jgi:lipoprotein-anchoring transpeptidase ErfK/SrfK
MLRGDALRRTSGRMRFGVQHLGSVWRPSCSAALVLAAACALIGGAPGCKKKEAPAPQAPADPDAGEIVAIDMPDAGPEAGAGAALPTVYALALITPILSAPEWPAHDPSKTTEERKGVIRLGYLRKGEKVLVKPTLVKKQSCLEGWFELAPPALGFICGKYATLDAANKELATAPHAPNMDGPLPYDYGLNLVNGAPLYRRPPLRKERAEYERGLAVGKAFRKKDDGSVATPQMGPGADGADTPWYVARTDRSQVSMDDLKGETSLIEKRMVKGFYLALDTKVKAFAGNFWRTTRGKFVSKEHVLVHDPKVEFEGVWLDKPGADGVTRHLPLAWVTNPHQWRYKIDDDGKKVHRNEHVDRFTILQLTGKKQVIDNKKYWETEEGWWFRDMDGTVANPLTPPKDVAPNEKWIDVNLGKQSLVAFVGDKPVFATIISSGRHDDVNPAKDHRTRAGDFRVREKHVSATMDNDTATDGPYSIEDVPWIMYFDGSTALHGAFWHSRFGHERSHGCVNMTPHDAHELFGWVGPTLPEGWHGIRATEANPGTRVLVHDDGKTPEESKESAKARKGDDKSGKDESNKDDAFAQ